MRDAFATIITAVGEDVNREGLQKTPDRAAKAFEFLTQGYNQDVNTVVNGALFSSDNREMVVVRDI